MIVYYEVLDNPHKVNSIIEIEPYQEYLEFEDSNLSNKEMEELCSLVLKGNIKRVYTLPT